MGGCGIVLGLVLAQVDGGSAPASDARVELFVAVDGDDSWSGTQLTPDGHGNGPVRTPQHALVRLRELRAADPKLRERTTNIRLSEGRWYLEAPLAIGPDDSGSPGHPVVISGWLPPRRPDGKPIIGPQHSTPDSDTTTLCAGRPINGWRAQKIHGHDVWVADVPDIDGKPWTFRELYIAGTRGTRARHPDRGYLSLAGLADADAPKAWEQGVVTLRCSPSDLATLREGGPADLTLMSRWVESHCRIDSIDVEHGVMTLRDKTIFKPDPGDFYYVESLAALDQPGEWWLDEKAKLVYVVAPTWWIPGDSSSRMRVIAPFLTRLVTVAGGDDSNRRVHDVELGWMRFEGAEWWYSSGEDPAAPRSSGAVQAAFDVPAAIELRNAHDVCLRRCEITDCGGYGIALGRGCIQDRIEQCDLTDLGGGGIKIGETSLPVAGTETSGNQIVGCTIRNVGRVFHSAVGIWIGQSPDNEIAQNTITDLYYTGISIGWTWGYGSASAGGNRVVHNEVGFVGKRRDGDGPILSDMGAIYTLGTQENTVIDHNYFHDVAAIRYGGWGIYFDEGSTHLHASGNLVLNTTHGGFHQHYGKENRVDHNLFGFGRDAQIQRSRPEEHTSFTFEHNVVLCRGGELFAGDLRDGHFDFHDNVYLASDPASLRFAGSTLAKWQAAGRENGSLVAELDHDHESPTSNRTTAKLKGIADVEAQPWPFGTSNQNRAWLWPAASPIWVVLGDERPGTRTLSIQRADQ